MRGDVNRNISRSLAFKDPKAPGDGGICIDRHQGCHSLGDRKVKGSEGSWGVEGGNSVARNLPGLCPWSLGGIPFPE